MSLALLLTLVWGILFVPSAFSAQVILKWDPNRESNIAGYKIYYGKQSKTYQFKIDVGNKTTVPILHLEEGQTYYLAATAYDASGIESPFSQELSFHPISRGRAQNNPGYFNSDNHTDILWQHQETGDVYVWFMDGSSLIRDQYILTIKELEWKIVGTGDFNGDGKPDILWHHQQRGDVYVWFMDGPTFVRDQHVRTIGDDLNWKIVGTGDFNGDGKPDILWHHQQRGDVYVWFMDGANFVDHQYIRTVPEVEWHIEAVGDYSGNGKPDIVWRNHRTGEVYVWFMDGPTFLTDQHILTVPDTNWKIVN